MDASSTPTAASPPPRIVPPTAGSRARGNAVAMATMSATNVIRTLRRVPRNRKPSSTEERPPRPASSGAAERSGGREGSLHTAQSAAKNVTTSTVYVHA